MDAPNQFLYPSAVARRLGISIKALRLYEQHGLIKPRRTAAGWRAYGPVEMARISEIAALRRLGLSLAQVKRVLDGDPQSLEPALAAHQAMLEARLRELAGTVAQLRDLRADLARGKAPPSAHLAGLTENPGDISGADRLIAFDLPWPWGGERFELHHGHPLTYITGPLGSGKTRLARAIAAHLPGAAFIGLERLANDAETQARIRTDPALTARVDRSLTWLAEEADVSPALIALVAALESEGPTALVIDMVEQGLDRAAQEAVASYLRHRSPEAPPLYLLTRSQVILDLTAIGAEAAIILCPANHSPPIRVIPSPAAPGYEAVATCLALPDVRARTDGMIVWHPRVA